MPGRPREARRHRSCDEADGGLRCAMATDAIDDLPRPGVPEARSPKRLERKVFWK